MMNNSGKMNIINIMKSDFPSPDILIDIYIYNNL